MQSFVTEDKITCSVSNTADSYYMDHSGNVRAGSAGSTPPDNSGVWSRLY
jgi:hypothetical protein